MHRITPTTALIVKLSNCQLSSIAFIDDDNAHIHLLGSGRQEALLSKPPSEEPSIREACIHKRPSPEQAKPVGSRYIDGSHDIFYSERTPVKSSFLNQPRVMYSPRSQSSQHNVDAGDPVEAGEATVTTYWCDPGWIQMAGVAVGPCVIRSLHGQFAPRSREPEPSRRPL